MMPSISTSVAPFTVTAMNHALARIEEPELCISASAELLPMVNLSWKPPWLPTVDVTCTSVSARSLAAATGDALNAPSSREVESPGS